MKDKTLKQVADGMIIESSGPITLSQAVVLVAGGAGASMASGLRLYTVFPVFASTTWMPHEACL